MIHMLQAHSSRSGAQRQYHLAPAPYPAAVGANWSHPPRSFPLSPAAPPFQPAPPPSPPARSRAEVEAGETERALRALCDALEGHIDEGLDMLPAGWRETLASAQRLLTDVSLSAAGRVPLRALRDRADTLVAAVHGVRQRYVFESAPAHWPGVHAKDVLLAVDGQPLVCGQPIWAQLGNCETITVRRGGVECCIDPKKPESAEWVLAEFEPERQSSD